MSAPLTAPQRLQAAFAGQEPAEALPAREKAMLMRVLCRKGWTDAQIAVHTRWTTYTVARIRDSLGLPANHEIPGAA